MARGVRQKGTPGRADRPQAEEDAESKDDKIRVVVRVRPFNSAEQGAGSREVVRVVGEQMLVFDPKEEQTPEYFHGKARRQRDINKRAAKDVKFMFDQVFDSNSHTVDLFENTTKKILEGLMDGFNCSVFAYGATGAGKTHTMLGSAKSPGVIFLTMMDLYRRMDEIKESKTCDIAVSYLEVYNEQIRDLLMPGGFLPVREDPSRGVTVTGLSLHKPHSAEELMHMLRIGNSNRTQHPTDANAESSRSHAVFQVFVRQRDRTANTSADWRVAKMSLIDLAGSERATVTKNRGARFREGANINRSLLALGNCINALADGKSKGYIPYRNSKLTRLLKDSLGGNCRTVMIAAVSPSPLSFEDTYSTLRYADRAKNIKVGLKRNVMSVDLHVSRYVQVIEDLRKEVNELKLKLRATEGGVVAASKFSPDLGSKATFERLITTVDSVFKARIEIRKEMLELESSSRDLQYKMYRKQLTITRINLIIPGEGDVTKCLMRGIESAQRRQRNINKRREAVQSRMNDNNTWLVQVEDEVEKSRPNNSMAELLDERLRTRHLEVELRDQRRQSKYLKKLCRAQEREALSMEKLNNQLLQTVYNQFMLIKGHNIASHKEMEQFETVQQMTSQNSDRSVAWADQSFGAGDDCLPVTPGASPKSMGLGLQTLLDFPILSGVPISNQARTPSQKNKMQTPSSGRRRKRTPRRTPRQGKSCIPTPSQSGKRCDHTPNRAPSSESRYEEPGYPAQKLFSAPNHGQSTANISVLSDEGVFPLQPSPAGNPPVPRTGGPEASPVLHATVAAKGHINQGQQAASIEPVAKPAHHPDHHPASSQVICGSQSDSDCPESAQQFTDNTIVLGPAMHLTSDMQCSQGALDRTMVIDPTPTQAVNASGLPLPIASSPQHEQVQRHPNHMVSPQTPPGGAAVTPDSVINSATVTKSRPVCAGGTVTKTVPGLPGNTVTKRVHSSATVTKSKPNDENSHVTPPNACIVRSMDFGPPNCSSPSGLLSFADVVKSPAPLHRLQDEPPPRSPLARRENIPVNSIPGPRKGLSRFASTGKLFNHSKEMKRQMTKPLADEGNLRRHTQHNRRVAEAMQTLKRYGLPSMLEKSSVPRGGPGTPGYMKGTKASSRRNKTHRRSITADEGSRLGKLGAVARRLVQKENAPLEAKKNLLQSRVRSTAWQ